MAYNDAREADTCCDVAAVLVAAVVVEGCWRVSAANLRPPRMPAMCVSGDSGRRNGWFGLALLAVFTTEWDTTFVGFVEDDNSEVGNISRAL